MFEHGSRSQQISTFMLPDDVKAFSDAVAVAIAGVARWETDQGHRIVPHDSLQAALQENGVQAFLRLLGRDAGTVGPQIQYMRTRVWTIDDEVLAATRGRFRADGRPEEMQPGRLAFKWFPEDEADCVQRDFATLAALVWKALKAVTSPHIDTAAGKPARRYRIGPAAKAWALASPDRLVRDSALPLKIRDLR